MQNSTNLMEAHEQWRNRPADQRFETVTALADAVNSRRLRSRSVDIDVTKIIPEDTGSTVVLNSAISPCEPSHWAFGQLATQIGAPGAYLRTLPRPLLTECLTHGLKSANREAVKFMTISKPDDQDGPNTLQAVTSTTYGRIWDADVVSAVQRIQERSGGKFHNPVAYPAGQFGNAIAARPSGLYASDHDVFMFLIDGGSLLEAGPRAQLNRGFIVWNSETGAKTFGLMTFLFNVVCGNHIVWGAQDVNKVVIRHTSGGPYRFDSQAAPALKAYVEASAKPLEDAVRRAQTYLLPPKSDKDADALAKWLSPHAKFSRVEIREAIAFAKSEEGKCETLWDFVQGATAYARGFDYIDARVDLEKRAGSLLDIVAQP